MRISTQGVKPYKKNKKNKKKFSAPPNFAVSNFCQSGPKKKKFFKPINSRPFVSHLFRIKRKNGQMI